MNRLVALLLALVAAVLAAVPAAASSDITYLEPDKAFVFSAQAKDAQKVEVRFDIAPGYYMYREQFRFAATGASLGPAQIPPGRVKFDETFQKDVETHRGTLRIVVPVQPGGAAAFALKVTSQGCADAGLCYPPRDDVARIDLALLGAPASVAVGSDAAAIETALGGGSFWPIVAAFFAAGLLLSLTPCVLPMLPIVSSIIVGPGGYGGAATVSRSRGVALAGAYSLGMAVVYTGLGIAAGLAGEGLAAALQNPWLLGAFAAGLAALALSMFGAWELRLPSAFVGRMTSTCDRLPAGRTAGVFAIGGISALIVSPCVAAPLAGAMLYLSQTRDVWLGGTALFSLAAGMSVPLLLIGASAGAVLPKAGAWMAQVKAVFGFVLLGLAIWTVSPALPRTLTLGAFGALALAAGVCLAAPRRPLWRLALGVAIGAFGALQLIGAATGGSDLWQPLAHLGRDAATPRPAGPRFVRVRDVAELDRALRAADRPVMLDFYADWCVSCQEMERFTFADPQVRSKLDGALLLQADVTANSADDRALLRRFRLFGPPGIVFFDRSGREVAGTRVIGYQKADRFLVTLGTAGL